MAGRCDPSARRRSDESGVKASRDFGSSLRRRVRGGGYKFARATGGNNFVSGCGRWIEQPTDGRKLFLDLADAALELRQIEAQRFE